MSTADELKQFKELLDEGIISQEEFDKEKKKLLSKQNSTNKKSEETHEEKKERILKESSEQRNKIFGYLFALIIFGSCYSFISSAYEDYPADEQWWYCVDEEIIDDMVYCPNGDVFEFKWGG